MERLALIAKLKPEAQERAEQLASAGAAGELDDPAIHRQSIFLAPDEVVFVVEGSDVELHLREWFDDPVRSTAISSWLPLLDGPLHVAREAAVWTAGAE
ncbi:MAG TPA: hypothetical protein VGI67_14710 [Thermoleophilaceae bacterium]|jgi:hypothetical protein